MTMNALDTALTRLAAASTALEYTAKPGLKDVENAKKEAKAAAEILDAAHKLMGYGVYTVASEPATLGVPLLDTTTGQPAPGAEIVAEPVLPELPGELQAWDGMDESEQLTRFENSLNQLCSLVASDDPAMLDCSAWQEAWDADPKDAFTRLLVALDRASKTIDVPTDEERDTWLAQFTAQESATELQPLPDLLGDFQALDEDDRFDRFDDVTNELANLDTSDDSDDDWWDKWKAAFEADPVQAFAKAVYALNHREPASVALPTDEEMAEWTAQFAPAAPQFDKAEFFASKLRELEEAGVSDGQKLKGWKKAAKAWNAEFEADADAATNKLLWRLQQVSVEWDVPSDEQVA